MIRRFLRWLARHEIALAVMDERIQNEFALRLSAHVDYLKGHQKGVLDAFNAMLIAIEAHRRETGTPGLTEEDLRRARNRMLH